MMKKIIYGMATAMVIMMSVACNNGKTEAEQRADSLQTANEQLGGDYNTLNEYLAIIAEGLDSIAIQEGYIFHSNSTKDESPALNREQIKRNLDAFQDLLAKQRQRVEELEKKLAAAGGDNKQLQLVVRTLKEQLEIKDAETTLLRAKLKNKNQSIEKLLAERKSMLDLLKEQELIIAEQSEAIATQDQIINTGFIKMGTKSELKKLGLLTNGSLFKKKKVDYSNIDQKMFERIDIRNRNKIEIPSKKAKVLTPVPAGTYTLEPSGDGMLLDITDPARFWSVSNFLIIQTD